MHLQPSRSEFEKLSAQGNIVPVFTEVLADLETPVSAYARLRAKGPSFLLESIEGGENLSRYSIIGCSPRKIFRCGPAESTITHADGREERLPTPQDPLRLLESDMARYKPVDLPGTPRFVGGAVGFLGYEYISRIEPTVPVAAHDTLHTPLLYFILADSLVIFDRARQTMRLQVNAHLAEGVSPDAAYEAAEASLRALLDALRMPLDLKPAALPDIGRPLVPPGNFTQDGFETLVDRTKEYIRAGDIIQVVLSQRFERSFSGSPLDLYRALRTVNPSPYMFILEAGDFSIVGASPEVHVRLTDGRVETRPIAGTRPRGKSPREDEAMERELLADEKERAEHLMLVDLARNDIGRVCQYGSITVPEFMIVERYSHVMHIVSQVEGALNEHSNAFDLMRATFPAGTVSGAPKIRAMQIIGEYEQEQRGFYAGVLGWFGYDGALDSCIMLRTALLRDGKVIIQSGAGLVADSVPVSEFNETIFKASALFKAVALADSI
ncbi:anthranilate synthase component I [Opitutales bacterium ASA1]|uniref:anthranilate synthase component I n=1 Tax=Congregicoccus parvus TaxID=3081749 RepID=UPI002B29021C|nr:anthranilate synthase component I [Opitutales bacterium ASA1]